MPADPSAVNDEIRQVEAIIGGAVLSIRQLVASELSRSGTLATEPSPSAEGAQKEEDTP